MNINTLLIGLGNIGMLYDDFYENEKFIESHAKAITLHPNFNLIAGIDTREKNRIIFEERFVKKTYKNLFDFDSSNPIDLVIIATPTNTHLDLIQDTLKRVKPKMILCEKPLSYNYDDAKKIIDLCEQSKTKLFVNYMRRCNPGVLKIKKDIESKFFASPFKGICWYSKGLYNNGSHFINLLEFWLGSFLKLKVINKGRVLNEFDNEPEFLIEFEKGDVIFRSAWEEYFSFYKVELLSSSHLLKYNKGGEEIIFYEMDNFKKNQKYKKRELNSNFKIYQYHVLDDIKKEYSGIITTICKGKEALATQRIIYLINKELQN